MVERALAEEKLFSSDGEAVAKDSDALKAVLESEIYTFLKSNRAIFDDFKSQVADLSTWEKIEIKDATIPEGSDAALHFRFDPSGQLNVISSIKLKWNLVECASLLIETDMAKEWIKTSDL